MPKKMNTNQFDIEQALETISAGLLELDSCDLTALGSGARAIDIAARLNAQYSAMEKLVKPLKDQIKVSGLEANVGSNQIKFILRGNSYQAVIRKINKTVLDINKIKSFFGPKKLPQYQVNREDIQVSFEVRE